MKRFAFPLERVREWRHTELDMEIAAAAALAAERTQIEEERRSLEAERLEAEAAVVTAPSVTAMQLAALDAFRRFVETSTGALDRRRADCEKRIAAQRRRILDARQRLELLNRLKERSWHEWRRAFDQEQENLASELFLARRTREGTR